MSKIAVAIIDPENKTIKMELIDNSYDGFRHIIGGSIDFKRLKLNELAEVLDGYDEKETVYAHGTDLVEGINISVHGSGKIRGHAPFRLGDHEYTLCYGKAIISGADGNWEDISIPYDLSFFKKTITWL